MLKKYPWYFVFLLLVILCLANIFQKMQWSTLTDNILWQSTGEGLVCLQAPEGSDIKPEDLLVLVNNYVVKNLSDLPRSIQKGENRIYSTYEIERRGLSKNVRVQIYTQYTPLSYYILAFAGVLMLLLSLRILNINIQKKKGFSPPTNFYLMSLTFSGFLIFSPTGVYDFPDFVYLLLDSISFLFFPALLLHFSLFYPLKSKLLRKVDPKAVKRLIYLLPVTILVLSTYFLISNLDQIILPNLVYTINKLRSLTLNYFALYLYLSLLFFIVSNLTLIISKKEKRFILPSVGITVSIASLLVFNYLLTPSQILLNLSLLLLTFMPLSLTYFLGHRKFTDIENVIRKTLAISFIFPFIIGIYFFLGSSIEQNKLLGIFWSAITILTAGLLFKPIESTVHQYFERLFFRGTFNFKRKLKDLTQSLPTERDLYTLSSSFLSTINNGFHLQKSAFIIHHRKNVFYSLPENRKLLLSTTFRNDLFRSNNLVLYSVPDFQKRYPKDYKIMKSLNYFQFLPLKTPEKLIGLVAFGPKKDNTYLNVEDWELLFNISSPLSLSVENATLYSELKTQLNEINLLKEFNENIIHNINLGIVVLSGLNIIKTWNHVMEEKFKIPAEIAINKKGFTIFGPDLWKKIYKGRRSINSIDNISIQIENEELIFDIYMSPLRDDKGKRTGTILVFEDVTDRVMIQNQLITAEKMASLGLLSAGIAHEVNTPLTGISSYCQLILDEPENPENIDLIQRIQEQVQRANKIIRSLLDFSRQKGEVPIELDVNKIINESIALVEHKLKRKNINLKTDYNFSKRIYGFSTRLQQLFINLLINAADAVATGEGKISITGQEAKEELIVRIKDNGKGIAGKHLDKIFDPFFTTKDEGKGTGLGLSIVYTIVQEHYGDIKANSNVGKGTTFVITFPIASPLRSIKL